MSKPKSSSRSWRERQERDPYVKMARRDGWRSRAVYKLEQIAEKEAILQRGMTVIDLGAAPGSWSQYVSNRLDGDVRIIALDLLPMDALPSVEFLRGDFTDDETYERLQLLLGNSSADLVMSDMAPNISGTKAVDQPRSMYLAELAFELAGKTLRRNGDFVCKLFQGQGTDAYIATVRKSFNRVKVLKPKASRAGSSEVYLLARNYQL